MPKAVSPIKPWLIHRCKIEFDQIRWDYMGSSEFEVGSQVKALKQLFKHKVTDHQVSVRACDGGANITVYLVAAKNFNVRAYQPYLQELADGKLSLKEMTRFNDAVDYLATGREPRFGIPSFDVWFDFTYDCDAMNAVFFTLHAAKRVELRSILKRMEAT